MIVVVLVGIGSIGSFIVGANEAFANWGFSLGDALYGLAFITLGYGFWSHRSEPVQPARPAPVS